MVNREWETERGLVGRRRTSHRQLSRTEGGGQAWGKPAKTCFNCLQPEGLTESSRWSRGKRGATTGIRRTGPLHPGRGARIVVSVAGLRLFWHPSGVQEGKGQFPVVVPPLPPNDHRLLSVNPSGWSSGEFAFAPVLRLTHMRDCGKAQSLRDWTGAEGTKAF